MFAQLNVILFGETFCNAFWGEFVSALCRKCYRHLAYDFAVNDLFVNKQQMSQQQHN